MMCSSFLDHPPNDVCGGKAIVEWCLGAAALQELTVLFVSSEVLHDKVKYLSGYGARLSTPDTGFDYVLPEDLKTCMRKTPGRE